MEGLFCVWNVKNLFYVGVEEGVDLLGEGRWKGKGAQGGELQRVVEL